VTSPPWDRVKALLAEAADRPAAAREQYVRQHCDDPDVQREVLALLAAAPAPLSDIVSAGALQPGARIGAYIVERRIGAGGMGEVYRARDSRLGRDVAIKVLPPLFAADGERLARFEREAKLLAALNHPHICTLFDVGREGGTNYLVMEHVDGESLASRVATGPLPIAKVLEYGRQIADALAKAHSRGIVHRDLKPANVMLTKSGAKLLDFGLARSGAGANRGAIDPKLVTTESLSGGLTAEGMLLGTGRYMAPEQLEGHEADTRSDIWALGCLLYEMLTARPAFEGRTHASLIAAILERDPATLPDATAAPPALEHVIRRCLAKTPDERWQSAADVRHELAWISESSGALAVSTSQPPRTGVRKVVIGWTAAAIAVVALAAGWFTSTAGRTRTEAPAPVMRFSLGLPEQFRAPGYFSISNDGKQVAFVAANPKRDARIVWIRSFDAFEPRPLAGTEGERQQPFWSPDGKSVGFFADNKLKRIELATGTVRVICDAERGRGGTWGRDGTIVFAPGQGTGLYRVASAGGTPEPLTQLASSPAEQSHRLPSFFSDGIRFVFTIFGVDGWYALAAGSTASSRTTELLKWRADPRYPFEITQGVVAGDFLLFARPGSLFAQRFDTAAVRLIGDPTAIASGVDEDDLGRQAFAVSENGTVVYRAASPTRDMRQLTWVARTGQRTTPVWEPGRLLGFSLASDGQRLVVAREDPTTNSSDIWIVDLVGGNASRLTKDQHAVNPWWSADGKTIFFVVRHAMGLTSLHSVPADGSRPNEVVNDAPLANQWPIGWDIDGSLIVVAAELAGHSDFSLWSFDVKRRERPKRIFSSDRGGLADAQLSPDGRLVAWSVGGDVYLQPLRGGARVHVAADTGVGSAWPQWRRDGRELYYVARGKLTAVQVRPGPGIELGGPQVLFDYPANALNFDVSADGQKFLIAMPVGASTAQQPLMVLMNWMSGWR
jgi:eukaryotic-like serine/threonine-protein kinase